MSKFKDLIGQKFHFLTPIKRLDNDRNNGAVWLCKCECGVELALPARRFTRSYKPQKSCMECYKKRSILHGMTNTKEFFAWRGILSRCNSKSDEAYHNYGGRGIKVCQRWLEFKNFFEDMGYAPSKKHSIDRIDNDGNYEPSNCRWAVSKVQQRNRRSNRMIEYNGEKRCLMEWAEITGLTYYCILERLDRGVDVKTALTTPSQRNKNKIPTLK